MQRLGLRRARELPVARDTCRPCKMAAQMIDLQRPRPTMRLAVFTVSPKSA